MYKNSLDNLRNVAERIRLGDYEQETIQPTGLMSKREEPSRKETKEEPEETFESALLGTLLSIKDEEVRIEVEEKEAKRIRPKSRGQAFGSDTGYRLVEDLIDRFGLTREQAAGFVGNLDYETGGFKFMQEIEPVVPGSKGGYGFAQWTGPRRRQFEAWSQEAGLDPSSYEANLGFLVYELENTPEGKVLEYLSEATTAEEAARIVSNKFLRPGKPNLGERMARASGYMEIE